MENEHGSPWMQGAVPARGQVPLLVVRRVARCRAPSCLRNPMIGSSVNLLFLRSAILLKGGPLLLLMGTAWGVQVRVVPSEYEGTSHLRATATRRQDW